MFHNGSIWGGLIAGSLNQLEDTRSLRSGQMDKSSYAVNTTENVTGAIGVMAGIEYGAVLGSAVLPGVGTVVGSLMGGLLGHTLGRKVGHQAGSMLVNSQLGQSAVQMTDKVQDVVAPN